MKFLTVNKVLKQRLLGAIDSLQNERDKYFSTNPKVDLKRINDALTHATDRANECEFELGWNQLFIAEQELVHCMNDAQRIIKANNLRIEASKISGWRQELIYLLLCKPNKDDNCLSFPVVDSAEKIIEALKVRNDFYNTRNNKLLLKRAGMDSLAVFLLSIIVLILACSFFIDLTNPPDLSWKIALAIMFGALGATFSMAHSLASSGTENKIPEQLLSVYMIIIRLAIGGTSAFIILMIYLSGFMDNLFSEVIIKSAYTYIVFSFLSGISERWVFNIISTITKDKEAADKNK